MKFEIRVALPSDALELFLFAKRSFWDTFSPTNDARDMTLYMEKAYSEEKQRNELLDPNNHMELGWVDGQIAGYFHLSQSPAELQRFYVDSKWHGQGLAQALMEKVLLQARSFGFSLLQLGVWEHNPRAIAFYKKFGFEQVGSRSFVLGTDIQTDFVLQRVL